MHFCYRHTDREAAVKCQRCERYICWECQIPNAVGVLCPEDGQVRQVKRVSLRNRPTLTIVLIAVNVAFFLLDMASSYWLRSQFIYAPAITEFEPWRMITAGFIHSSFLHVGLNMYSLYIFGSALEPALGKLRFATVYFLAILGGSVGVLLLDSPDSMVLGASGGIFGLMGAYFVVLRSLGENSSQMMGLIAINLVMGFLPGLSISWQAHVGGLVVGGLVAFIYSKTRYSSELGKQKLMLAGVLSGLLLLTIFGVVRLGL